LAVKDDGIYLITGGRGGLGTLFANEILGRTRGTRVVLAGRSPVTVHTADAVSDPRRSHRQVDVCNLEDVRNLIASIRDEYGRLDGIIHAAGIIADYFILRKDNAEFLQVLAPKVTGTMNLDEATRNVDLDFFVLFSAIGAATGNIGQADYAAANGFLDHFAAHRNRQVADGLRRGRTRSIDWPLWQDGGMGVDAATRERLQETIGMQPMQTATGMDAFHRAIELPHDQLIVVEGDLARIRRAVLAAPAPTAGRAVAPEAVAAAGDADLAERTQHYLRKQFAELLKLSFENVDPRAALENYGMDSILAMKLTSHMESTFGSLPKTLFFEYQTIRELAGYFVEQHSAQLRTLFATATPHATDAPPARPAAAVKTASKRRSGRRKAAATARPKHEGHDEPIAIIGLSGRYPESVDLDAYWNNLRDGKDCITEVPKERWDWREYYAEDRTATGRHYSKWGGFIQGVDEFDPLFFNLSPVEAEGIDPQERLFLQHVWMAIEDAGYTRASLQVPFDDDLAGQVGVYVGVMYTEYQLLGADATARGNRLGVASSGASVANRVSYQLNLHGPSMTLDTMCSSSLTAIHVACQDLKLGRTSLAIAGGVNVSIHPNKYLILSAGQFISSAGHCQSFGEGGDGYIPGEGVGVVVLKRLSEAERDGDHIYGVIRGTALNHGGKTNGYSVPNPQAQSGAIRRALAESGVDARHISYIEAHGTGTKLGDPIEIAALSKAFGRYTTDTGFALIGSAKSNIGHCESAAGIAGLTKVLLQMQHRQIAPSLHSEQLNPHIDFASTPFIVNQTLRPWDQPVIDGRTIPRLAGISSFGAGGSNAHVIVEEYQAPVRQAAASTSTAIVLSARTPEQLRQKVRDLVECIEPRRTTIDPAAMAYTLQTGREAMEERLAFVVTSVDELFGKMQAWLAGEQGLEQTWQASVKRGNEWLSLFSSDADLQQTVGRWVAGKRLSRVLELWVKGLELDWSMLYGEQRPQRISLPAYPFARERYWIDVTAGAPASIQRAATAVLHPLLHSNTSDLSEQRYRSTFTGDEFFLTDHRVKEEKVLPGVAYLEMARAAVERALPERPEAAVLELRNVVWVQPIVVREARQVDIALTPADDGS
ncbi:MAG: polyketide synthase PksN, partial [Acidobacteriota bacterium]|nr:polyketide synthase PksN [Acidobacteriota bacterium]